MIHKYIYIYIYITYNIYMIYKYFELDNRIYLYAIIYPYTVNVHLMLIFLLNYPKCDHLLLIRLKIFGI